MELNIRVLKFIKGITCSNCFNLDINQIRFIQEGLKQTFLILNYEKVNRLTEENLKNLREGTYRKENNINFLKKSNKIQSHLNLIDEITLREVYSIHYEFLNPSLSQEDMFYVLIKIKDLIISNEHEFSGKAHEIESAIMKFIEEVFCAY